VLHATLDLLDRQLRDRQRALCGNVDDLELTFTDDGDLYVTALLSGGGALAYRMGRRRLGTWLHRASERLHDDDHDRSRIPMAAVTNIGPSIDIAADAGDLANHDLERWVGTHIIDNIPGGSHRAAQ
jgi:hypothetical protein